MIFVCNYPLDMIIICATLFINPNIDDRVTGRREQVSLKSMHKVYVQTVTLIIDLTTWFSLMTHCFVMMIICTKLFSNLTMHDKVMLLTGTSSIEACAQSLRADFDLDL